MRILALLLLALAPLAAAEPFDHSVWDQILQQRVSAIGEVDYAALSADSTRLDEYLAALAAESPENAPSRFPSREHELAYWINAYNAFTLQGVLDNYPLESIRKVGKFFDKTVYVAGGRRLSLDDVEHGILRRKYKEPRIHFAIVCASVSCPLLWNRAVTGDQLDEQLDALAKTFINQRRNLDVNAARKQVKLSKIFEWFEEDFESATGGKGSAAVLSFVRRFASQELETALLRLDSPKVRYFPYDWSLNQPGSRAASSNRLEADVHAESAVQP